MKPGNELGLGDVVPEEGQHRDAIHVAVIPVIAEEELRPGQHVGVRDGKANHFLPHVGVIDPFLGMGGVTQHRVLPGQRVWLLLNPGTITSLRHEWLHPSFPLDGVLLREREESELWLRKLAGENGIDYTTLVEGAASGRGAVFYGQEAPSEVRSAEFWRHIEVVTGACFDNDHRDATYFGCTC